MFESLLSADQVCARLGNCSRRKLRRLVDQGRLSPRAFEGNTVYPASEVDALISSVVSQTPGRAKFRGTRKSAEQ